MKLYKNLMPATTINDILLTLEDHKDKWEDNFYIKPYPAGKRMRTLVEYFPMINSFVEENFSSMTLQHEKVYFVLYNETAYCAPHFDPVSLTAIIILKKADKGGKLVVEKEIYDLDVGDVFVFDSSKLHSVTPIVKGERLSLNLWFV